MLKSHAVGIDLGTTYSCIAYLNEHGEPVTLANQEGELSTPSAVFFDGSEIVVGTEALRNAIVHPTRVVQNSKRQMGNPRHFWVVDGKRYSPVEIATLVLKKLLSAATEQIGEFDTAVITVPAQFSELQRQATVEAGLKAGLKHVDIINEPVAAALCYVLGTEGLWFTELADSQQILVYDLGGGTFDLSLVKYEKDEVSVIASGGDLNLGGIDWNNALEKAIASQFSKEFKDDPRSDAESLQYLANEVENAKRSLTVRPRAALTCQHGGHRKSYQVEQEQFEKLTKHLLERTAEITQSLLTDNGLGWAHVDAILTTGGSSRMPMVRRMLKEIGGRTLNTSLSPDQSIAHGATYYAGMLLTNSDYARSILSKEATQRLAKIKQHSVNARALGILVRNTKKNKRFPHYLIPANTPLPTSITQTFGTVVVNQERVNVHIVESGTAVDKNFVELGTCVINNLPPNLPEGSEIAVTISYDDQARVHVSARDVTSGKEARTEIVREVNVIVGPAPQQAAPATTDWVSRDIPQEEEAPPAGQQPAAPQPAVSHPPAAKPPVQPVAAKPAAKASAPAAKPTAQPVAAKPQAPPQRETTESSRPVPLCNECGEPLDSRGRCKACGATAVPAAKRPDVAKAAAPNTQKPVSKASLPPLDDAEIMELDQGTAAPAAKPRPVESSPAAASNRPAARKPSASPQPASKPAGTRPPDKKPAVKPPPLPKTISQPPGNSQSRAQAEAAGEEEFWEIVE